MSRLSGAAQRLTHSPTSPSQVWFFKRGSRKKKGGTNRRKLFDMMDRKLAESPEVGLIVYPEGHRSQKPDPLPLKYGCIQYAYESNMDIQVIIGAGKEQVFNEQAHVSRLSDGTIHVAYSTPVRRGDKTMEEFIAEVRHQWAVTWAEAYGSVPKMEWEGGQVPPQVVVAAKRRSTPGQLTPFWPEPRTMQLTSEQRARVTQARKWKRAVLVLEQLLLLAAWMYLILRLARSQLQ